MPFFIFFPSYFYIVTPEVLASPISTQSKTFLVKKTCSGIIRPLVYLFFWMV
ncbi:hypothetical protein FM120_00955 [Sphingobacterium faecium PCAi_F2.5]|nr:hypothetical protein FM120_00955 [Sphingobacterium faecium PCAi_F2.5]